MIFYILVMTIIFILGFYLLYKIFYKEWKKANIDQKLEDEELASKIVIKIEKKYNPKEVKKNKSIIDYFNKN